MVPVVFKPLAELRLDDTEIDDPTKVVKIPNWSRLYSEVNPIVVAVKIPALALVPDDPVASGEIVVPRDAKGHDRSPSSSP